jgi:hypothetical protein
MHTVLTWPVGHDADSPRSPVPPFGPVGIYVVGTAVGGLAFAAVGSAVGLALGGTRSSRLVLLAVGIAAVAVVFQLLGRIAPLPEHRAQVPRQWLLWPDRRKTALAFGLIIGAMVLTHLRHASAYVLGTIIFLAPSLASGVALGGAYGVARGMPLVLTWASDRLGVARPAFGALTRPSADRRVRRALAAVSVVSFVGVLAIQPVTLIGG